MAWLGYRRVVLALLWAGIALPATADATDIPVTTSVDSMSADGQCSLREALWAANNASPINGDCPTGGGADRILLGATTYPIQLTSSNEDLGNDGDFDVRSDVTVVGAREGGTVIDGAGKDRVFHVALGNASLVLDHVTVRGGLTGNDGVPGTNGRDGGGILNVGTLTVQYSVIRDNQTGNGLSGIAATGGNGSAGQQGVSAVGGTGGVGGSGGGIFSSGTLTVTRSSIVSNVTGTGGTGGSGTGGRGGDGPPVQDATAGAGGSGTGGAGGQGGSGAGIFSSGTLQVSESTFTDNAAGASGAGGAGTGGSGGNGTSNGSDRGSFGGAGGTSLGGAGGAGAPGGGIRSTAESTITATTFEGNRAGAGGSGGAAGGPPNGLGGASAANDGGDGGASTGGAGGVGGSGGAMFTGSQTTLENLTVVGNQPGNGGAGASARGGDAGATAIGGPGDADGGSATGGAGGAGGSGGALTSVFAFSVVHATIDSNAAGATGPGGGGTGGARQGNGALGFASPGAQGAVGGGAVASGGNVTLTNSIVAYNSPSNCSGAVTDGGGNIRSGDFTCPGFLSDPKLGALQDNGGYTQTQELGAGSAALDTAGAAACASTDQREIARPEGAGCDAGAYELVVPPVNTAPPSISGTPAVGQTLTCDFGKWNGYPSYSIEWRRETSPIATGPTYRVAAADAGHTLVCRVAATNFAGTSAANSAGVAIPADTTPPALSSYALSVTTFRAAGAGGSVASARSKAPIGTRVTFTVSEPSTVTFTTKRLLSGRKSAGKCERPSKKNRKGKPCKRLVMTGSFKRHSVAGVNTFKFTGRIKNKNLAPGSYTLTAQARDPAGNKSRSLTKPFKIVR